MPDINSSNNNTKSTKHKKDYSVIHKRQQRVHDAPKSRKVKIKIKE